MSITKTYRIRWTQGHESGESTVKAESKQQARKMLKVAGYRVDTVEELKGHRSFRFRFGNRQIEYHTSRSIRMRPTHEVHVKV